MHQNHRREQVRKQVATKHSVKFRKHKEITNMNELVTNNKKYVKRNGNINQEKKDDAIGQKSDQVLKCGIIVEQHNLGPMKINV